MKGNWNREVFRNEHPIVLELGCGKGEYTVALGREYPEKNFIGIDLKSNRMWKGAGIAEKEGLENVAFMRIVIDRIHELFAEGEVSEIWITFPDPFPKDRHAKHRLLHPGFIRLYRQILKPGGTIHLKTDDHGLFHFTNEMFLNCGVNPIQVDWDIHNNPGTHPHLKEIRTHYENLFMQRGLTIKYAKFTLEGYDDTKASAWEKWLKAHSKRKTKMTTSSSLS